MDTRKYKTEFKWFTIPQWEEEEQYLTEMNKQGWEFSSVTFPGFYRFVKTEPAEVIFIIYLIMFANFGFQYFKLKKRMGK